MNRRVAFVCHWDWVLHRFRLPVARALLDAGIEVVAVCPAGPWVAELERAGLRWREWPMTRGRQSATGALRATASLVRILRDERPVAAHLFTIEPIVYGSLAARIARVPTTIAAFSGMGWLFSDAPGTGRLRRVVLPLLRRSLAGAHATVMNPADLELVSERLPRTDCRLVPEGVDTDAFRPTDTRDHEIPRIVCACRLLRDKGVEDLVEAARELASSGVDAEIVIAGSPDPGNPDSLTADDVQRLAATSSVQFPGHVDDVAELLRTADIAVLPTRYPEGAPRFLMEAAACGLPSVATDIPGCRQVVNESTGVLVPTSQPTALAAALRQLIDNPERRARMGDAARAHAVESLDDRHVTRAHVAMYGKLGIL